MQQDATCYPNPVTFTDLSDTNGGSALSGWSWNFGDGQTEAYTEYRDTVQHVYDSASSFPAQLIVTDLNNCRDTAKKTVNVYPTPIAAFNVTSNYNSVTGQVLLISHSQGATGYLWDFGDGNQNSTVSDSVVYRYSSVGIFNILLTATNNFMCSDTASYVYDLTSGLFVPNAFAPGSDNPRVNTFKPVGVKLKKYDIQIYSQWGILLWESKKLTANGEPAEGWDGTYEGQPMPAGDYIWRINAKFLDNSIWQGSDNGDGNTKSFGTLSLIR